MPQKCSDPHSSSTKNISAVRLHCSHLHPSPQKISCAGRGQHHRMANVQDALAGIVTSAAWRPYFMKRCPSRGDGGTIVAATSTCSLRGPVTCTKTRSMAADTLPHIPLLLAGVQRLATSPTELCVGHGEVDAMTRSSSPILRRPPSSVTTTRLCWCRPRLWWWHGDNLIPARRR
jgi:hypothetical protein